MNDPIKALEGLVEEFRNVQLTTLPTSFNYDMCDGYLCGKSHAADQLAALIPDLKAMQGVIDAAENIRHWHDCHDAARWWRMTDFMFRPICPENKEAREWMDKAAKEIERLEAGLKLLYSWADNWDSPFMEDDEWLETDGPKIRALLRRQGGGE